jgi:multidrug efflux pump subunit AcrA (membrane-fusion protein)
MRGKWLLLSGVAVFLAIAAGALSLLRQKSTTAAPAAAHTASPVGQGEITLSGTVQPQEVVSIAAPVDGTVEAYYVEEGQEVAEGQLLAQIRSTGLEAERDVAAVELERARGRVSSLESRLIAARLEASRARAEASRAREEFEKGEKAYLRQAMLYREGATPRLAYEGAQQAFDAAKSLHESRESVARAAEERVSLLVREEEAARQKLAEQSELMDEAGAKLAAGQVYSPVDGLLVGRRGQAGEVVTKDSPDLLEVAVHLERLEVALEPPPDVLSRLRPGLDALIQLAEVSGQGIPGKVVEVRDGTAFVEFLSPNPAVKPGLTAQVRVRLSP